MLHTSLLYTEMKGILAFKIDVADPIRTVTVTVTRDCLQHGISCETERIQNFADLFNCTPVGRASDLMRLRHKAFS